MPARRRARVLFRSCGLAACLLAALSCTRSRDPSDGGAAHGGETGGKGGSAAVAGQGGEGGVAGKGGAGGDGGKGGRGPSAGVIGDAGPGSLVPVEGGFCCTPSATPGCCMIYGGFSTHETSGCGDACDGMPSPWEAWTLATDKHGCKYWVEPREWTDCCGCAPDPRACNANGTWLIEYEQVPCGPNNERITITSDEDAGTAEVTFESRGQHSGSCSGAPTKYEASVSISPNGCVVTLASHEKWCSGFEDNCDDLELKLYLKAFSSTAEVEGTYHSCWCGTSGPPDGSTVKVKGTANPIQ